MTTQELTKDDTRSTRRINEMHKTYVCSNCNKEVTEIPIYDPPTFCVSCYHVEVARSQKEDMPDSKSPWIRTRPPKYILSKEQWKEFGYQ